MEDYFYVIVDESCEEKYFVLGSYKIFKESKNALLEEVNENEPISECYDDFENFCIRQYKFGWGDAYKEVFKITREKVYEEDNEEYSWKIIETVDKSKECYYE